MIDVNMNFLGEKERMSEEDETKYLLTSCCLSTQYCIDVTTAEESYIFNLY